MVILEEYKPMLVSEFVGMLQERLKWSDEDPQKSPWWNHNFYMAIPTMILGQLWVEYGAGFIFEDESESEKHRMACYRQVDPGLEILTFDNNNMPKRVEHLLSRIREKFVHTLFCDLEIVVIGHTLTISRKNSSQ